MSEEKRRSSIASTAAPPITIELTDQVPRGGRPQGGLEVAVSEPIKGHGQPLPSLKSYMIDNLAQLTACNLVVMVRASYRMEVEKGLVYPHRTLLDDVQIDTSAYDVVKVDVVHENTKNMKLEVPLDDTTLILWDAITRRV
jgi:hypothetical protein